MPRYSSATPMLSDASRALGAFETPFRRASSKIARRARAKNVTLPRATRGDDAQTTSPRRRPATAAAPLGGETGLSKKSRTSARPTVLGEIISPAGGQEALRYSGVPPATGGDRQCRLFGSLQGRPVGQSLSRGDGNMRQKLNRRIFLKGLGGACVAAPFLGSIVERGREGRLHAGAQAPDRDVHAQRLRHDTLLSDQFPRAPERRRSRVDHPPPARPVRRQAADAARHPRHERVDWQDAAGAGQRRAHAGDAERTSPVSRSRPTATTRTASPPRPSSTPCRWGLRWTM